MRTIKELTHLLSVLCFRFVWCGASWLARGTQIQYNVETKTRQNKKTKEQKEGELTEEEQQLWRSDTGGR